MVFARTLPPAGPNPLFLMQPFSDISLFFSGEFLPPNCADKPHCPFLAFRVEMIFFRNNPLVRSVVIGAAVRRNLFLRLSAFPPAWVLFFSRAQARVSNKSFHKSCHFLITVFFTFDDAFFFFFFFFFSFAMCGIAAEGWPFLSLSPPSFPCDQLSPPQILKDDHARAPEVCWRR